MNNNRVSVYALGLVLGSLVFKGFGGLCHKTFGRFLRVELVLLAVPYVIIANIDSRGWPLTSPTIRFSVSSVI